MALENIAFPISGFKFPKVPTLENIEVLVFLALNYGAASAEQKLTVKGGNVEKLFVNGDAQNF